MDETEIDGFFFKYEIHSSSGLYMFLPQILCPYIYLPFSTEVEKQSNTELCEKLSDDIQDMYFQLKHTVLR